jgi:tetratricopeptide (TPR) repeat protein
VQPVPPRWTRSQSLENPMQPANNTSPRSNPGDTQTIRRAIWVVLGLLLVVLVSFAGIYVWDRYFHAQPQAPGEREIEQMEVAVHEEPQDPQLRIALAESYLRAGWDAKALEQADQVLRQVPDDANALLIAGISQVRLDRPEAALVPLQRFVALRKDGPMARTDTALEAAYYYLGQSYVELGQPAAAIPLLEAALLISPIDADALYQLGLALDADGQPELAVQKYGEAVRLVPDFEEAYRAMTAGYAALDRPDHVMYAQGMVAFCRKDYQAAVSNLERATEALPGFAPAFLGLGLSYEGLGNLEPALSAIERALELDPNDFAARQAIGRLQAAPETQN